MIRHILRLVWNRKTSNALILAEIVCAFLVVFVVAALAVFFWNNARQPMGFDGENLWYVRVAGVFTQGEEAVERQELERQLFRELKALDSVEQAAVLQYPPYIDSHSIWGWSLDGRDLRSELIEISDDGPEVLGLELLQGRWFEPGDEQLAFTPAILNQRLAREIFGQEDPIGKAFADPPQEPNLDHKEHRVVGVFRDYRKEGEFAAPRNMLLLRQEPGDPDSPVQFIALRMRPGTPVQEEAAILVLADRIAPAWSFEVKSIAAERAEYRRGKLTMLALAGLVAGFLLLMVALGLLGVLWQSVTQRTQEIGLRRANGADARRIYQQILGEIAAVAVLALLVGTVLVAQLPLTGWLTFLTPTVALQAFVLAFAFMLALALVCGLYPSWLATRVLPAEALHYD
jgi:putative ABC transport system permease protein